ncbi:FAD:protein FMN transferase [Petrocella atlantisensis]|uniref:FAD:protein FMN transferase n=1 Tax=Petrocella atlantisensis TaxID=2173034 RepID=A0A3P7PUT3_9FIRM|nr:FAD:protein FMN transferase [Petrocella atlantisensis]PKM54770.1 MAG: thiamine biosynthesis protein ApbE [Firmicutes bacterium HGW-Firmicutes-5]VDN47707.1 FAD:protein FMN transferase [Petrocella atlantisensis]
MLKRLCMLISLLLFFTGCAAKDNSTSESITTYALDTVITINLYDEGSEAIFTRMTNRINEIETLMSKHIAGSEVDLINQNAGIKPVVVSQDTYKVVERALMYAKLSKGSFDPTIGPIVDLWGIGTEEARVPSRDEITQKLNYVDYEAIILDEQEGSVYLSKTDMSIDLGAIAKGFVADELVLLLRNEGISKAIINLGGNVYAYGEKDNGDEWKIAIQTPYDQRNVNFGYVEIKDKTVVTSGPYERYFEEDGKTYHHIFDANTGYPIDGETVSVTIVTQSSMDADALSTLLFTMNQKEGLDLIESIDGVECLYIDQDYEIRMSSGFEEMFTLTDHTYKIVDN